MHMSFWWGTIVKDYLFKGLSVDSTAGLIGICVCIAVMSFTFECLRYLQAKQRQKELLLRSRQLQTICPRGDNMTLINGEEIPLRETVQITTLHRTCLVSADLGLWFTSWTLAYVLMLSIMLYNVWFFLSVMAGGGVGYFIFGQKFMKLNLQNCQIIRDTWCMQNCGEDSEIRNGESTPVIEASTSRQNIEQHLERHAATVHSECH